MDTDATDLIAMSVSQFLFRRNTTRVARSSPTKRVPMPHAGEGSPIFGQKLFVLKIARSFARSLPFSPARVSLITKTKVKVIGAGLLFSQCLPIFDS